MKRWPGSIRFGQPRPAIAKNRNASIGTFQDADVKDRIEQRAKDYFQRVRENYLWQVKQWPERYRLIDAGKPIAHVEKQVLKVLGDFFTQPRTASASPQGRGHDFAEHGHRRVFTGKCPEIAPPPDGQTFPSRGRSSPLALGQFEQLGHGGVINRVENHGLGGPGGIEIDRAVIDIRKHAQRRAVDVGVARRLGQLFQRALQTH